MPRGTREETSPLPAIIGLEESGLVGIGVGLTIQHIITGEVHESEVEFLISDLPHNTKARWRKEVEELVVRFWSHDPDRAEKIFWKLWEEGRIIQPALTPDRWCMPVNRETEADIGKDVIWMQITDARKWYQKKSD